MRPVTRWWAVTDRAQPGVVIQPGQDLGAGPVRQRPVGEVGLPALVGLGGFEPQAGRSGALGRVGGDQPGPGQVAADGGGRDLDLVVVGQVPADGVRPGVQALPGQFLVQPHDQVPAASGLIADGEVFGRRDRGSNAASPSARYRATSRDTQPLRHPVGPGYLPLAPALGDDSGDDKTRLRHPPTVPPRVFLCPETRHSHVLKLDTIAGATQTSVISPLTCDSAGSEGIFVAQEAPARSKIPTKSPQPARGGGARQAKSSRTAPGRMLAGPQAAGRRVTGGLLNISSSAPGRATPCTVAG